MEWTRSLRQAINYMETHLLEDIGAEEVAAAVHISPVYFQKGFKIMTGLTVGEYIRGRRLYMAALDLLAGDCPVIELAYRYGYDTPESFTKAFSRFHGVSPSQLRGNSRKIRTFLPLKITIQIQGGNDMDYRVEQMEAFQIIGFKREFAYDSSFQKIPQFWDEFNAGCSRLPADAAETVERCMIGEFGVCLEDMPGTGKFHYIIGGRYDGGAVPEGMEVVEIPGALWAKFTCTGPLPGSLQSVNERIFKEWLPGNPDYEFAMDMNIEWYSAGDMLSADYESGIWIPVRSKK